MNRELHLTSTFVQNSPRYSIRCLNRQSIRLASDWRSMERSVLPWNVPAHQYQKPKIVNFSQSLNTDRLCVISQWFNDCSEEIRMICSRALEQLCENYGWKVSALPSSFWATILCDRKLSGHKNTCIFSMILCPSSISIYSWNRLGCGGDNTRDWNDEACALPDHRDREHHFPQYPSQEHVCSPRNCRHFLENKFFFFFEFPSLHLFYQTCCSETISTLLT